MVELFVIGSFFAALIAGRQSAGLGMAIVIWVGGFYGIVRANFFDVVTHFMFDAAVMGFYLSRAPFMFAQAKRQEDVRRWTLLLLLWPLTYFALGFFFSQHPLIQLLGLRAAIWFVPFIFIGAQFTSNDIRTMAIALAGLNLVSFGFALAQYIFGVEMFFPRNSVTEIIYNSKDIAGFTAYRIPATFSSSAAYGGYLVASFPVIVANYSRRDLPFGEKLLMLGGLLTAMIGVFLCGSRSPVVAFGAMFVVASFLLRHRVEVLAVLVLCSGLAVYQVLQNERLQRISTLVETESTLERISQSANLGILDVLAEYPFGVGLGGAVGTSIPSFLAQYSPIHVGAENEYARIALEQSVVGVMIWVGFVIWICRKRMYLGSSLVLKLMLAFVCYSWLTAFLGTGTTVAIPQSPILFTYMGACAAAGRNTARAAPSTAVPASSSVRGLR